MSDRGLFAFLFTDIEGSTRRWQADADGMRAALAIHDSLLAAAVQTHGGALFKHTGDGICAAFPSPNSAVSAAVAAQGSLELPVRMGIATGEAEMRDGDYFGVTLNRAARVMAAGHGGQILLDGATAGLVSGVELMDLGPRTLRDVDDAVHLFQVTAPGLRADFPPPRTEDARLGNLKTAPTLLIGREDELTELCAALPAQRLTTLTGVGGVGKTRLALEAARRGADAYPGGVWVVELAPVGDPVAVPDAVAATLGITQQSGMNMVDSIATAMEGKPRLLVIDNCEHVLDAVADLVGTILERSSTVTILATSREGLRLAGERLWPVPSLETTGGWDSDAAALFIDRARAVAPGISLAEPDEAEAVVEICHQLDGIPLAIELAASRIQSMTVTEVRDRLGDRFRLLVGARRGQERHQTLRHAVRWSVDLLDDTEKRLLTVCSVFSGGFDLPAVCVVAGIDDDLIALDHVDALVRKSLLVADRTGAHTRYSMLETIRQFAEEQLADSGAAADHRDAHARYFAGRESDIMATWNGPRQRDAYGWLGREMPNLRAAFRWAADRGDLDTAATIAVYVSMISLFVEQYEPFGWAAELLPAARVADHRRLAQLYTMASRTYHIGNYEQAMEYAESGLQVIDSGRYDVVPYEMDSELPGVYLQTGQIERCNALHRKRIEQSQDSALYARGFLAINLTMTGELDEALAVSEILSDVTTVTDNPAMVSWALLGYGFARHSTDPVIALDAHRRGAQIAVDTGNRLMQTYHTHNLARLAATFGDPGEALDFFRFTISNYLDAGHLSLLAQPLGVLAAFFDHTGRPDAAAILTGFTGDTPFVQDYYPEVRAASIHLRAVLGNDRYEELSAVGAAMTGPEAADYALNQIALARSEIQ